MTIRDELKKVITGLTIPQEYLCLALEDFTDPLKISVSPDKGSTVFADVTSNHLFLGYKPVVIGIYNPDETTSIALSGLSTVVLNFHYRTNRIASLSLTLVDTRLLDGKKIFLYKAVQGDHEFLNTFHRFINHYRLKFRKQELGNVDLPGNLIDQVRIAYAVPRIIGLITLSDGSKMNMFPTDLHGPVNDRFYIGSLRIGGKANEQVEVLRKVVLAQMSLSTYKEVYRLGKNHMRDLAGRGQFTLHDQNSDAFDFPLPAGVLRYWELSLMDSCDIGIHRVHMYRIINFKRLVENGKTLAHIHQYYAQWRQDRKIPTQLLLR
ncbi:MAG TPA: hypothetical protein VFW11_21225 [Cyclobacteriaceae bacterium]|nr:hypothetical protein [Cyclobacteriaceae bacterium]